MVNPVSTRYDFITITDAISYQADEKADLRGSTLILKGSQTRIKFEDSVSEMGKLFRQMSPEDRRKNKNLLNHALNCVRASRNFSTSTKVTASVVSRMITIVEGVAHFKESLGRVASRLFTSTSTERSERAARVGREALEVKGAPIDPEKNPGPSLKALNKNAETTSGTKLYDTGKEISATWEDKTGKSVTERIIRKDTIADTKLNAEKELAYIKSRLKEGQLDPNERVKLQAHARRLENTINKCSESKLTWAKSDYFRDMLRGNSGLRSRDVGLEGAINEFERVINERYLPLAPPVNMRYHTCSSGTNSLGWLRVGMITDMSNGFTNLSALKSLDEALQKNDESKANFERNVIARDIIRVWSNAKGNKNIDASAGFALKQLGFSMDEIKAIKGAIDQKQPANLAITDLKHVQETVAKTLLQRTEVMHGQFLQLVADHATRINADDIEKGRMVLLHVSLLNQGLKNVDGSGWVHNEDYEMKDMAALFENFDGKKLISDPRGPFIDEEGNIHVPSSENFPENKEIELKSIFANLCVQGHTRNNGTQRILNHKAYGKLRDLGLDPEGTMQRLLLGRSTGYTQAADLMELALKKGVKASDGCAMAKDRTGFVSALTTDRMLRDTGFSQNSRRRVLRDQLGTHSPQVQVVKDNTGTPVMKIYFRLEGVSKNTYNVKSFTTRCVVYARQAIEILKEQRRIRQWEETGKP